MKHCCDLSQTKCKWHDPANIWPTAATDQLVTDWLALREGRRVSVRGSICRGWNGSIPLCWLHHPATRSLRIKVSVALHHSAIFCCPLPPILHPGLHTRHIPSHLHGHIQGVPCILLSKFQLVQQQRTNTRLECMHHQTVSTFWSIGSELSHYSMLCREFIWYDKNYSYEMNQAINPSRGNLTRKQWNTRTYSNFRPCWGFTVLSFNCSNQ